MLLRVVPPAVAGGVTTQRLEFAPSASFQIGRRNLFGKNRSVNLFTSFSLYPSDSPVFTGQTAPTSTGTFGFSEYRVLGTFREPRIFDTSADALLTGTLEQQIRSTFNFARRGAGVQVGRRLTRDVSATAAYQIQRTQVFDQNVSPSDQLLIDRTFPQVLLSSFSTSVIDDTRNDAVAPGTGHYLSANGQLAARAIGSEVGFVKSFFTAQIFRTLPHTNRIVFAGDARLGLATGLPRDLVVTDPASGQVSVEQVRDLPISERFFAGGDTTVRGFALDALGTPDTISSDGSPNGGNGLVIFNVELRVPIWSALGAVGFIDTGNVFARASDIDLGELQNRRRRRAAHQVSGRPHSYRRRLQAAPRGDWDDGRARRTDGAAHQFWAGVLMVTRMQNAKCRMQIYRRLRRRRGILHFTFCLAVAVAAASVSVAAETIDRVLAVASNELIMLSDVTAAHDLGLVPVPAGATDQTAAILAALIDRELILAEVDRYAPPEPGADAVDRELQTVRARFATPAALAAALSKSGIDENHLRQTLRENLRIRGYEDQRFVAPVPSDDELGRYYREHPEAFARQGTPIPFEAARPDLIRLASEDRRKALIADWVAGLRRRSDVTVLYLPGR